jgi:hypothetical protein
VYAAPLESADQWPQKIHNVTFARCPAELADNFSCQQCGGGRPLCARGARDFVVVFVAHGTGKKKVGKDEDGGCYAASGPVAIQWHNTRKNGAKMMLQRFANLCALSRMVLFCATISRAIVGGKRGHRDHCNNCDFLGALVVT